MGQHHRAVHRRWRGGRGGYLQPRQTVVVEVGGRRLEVSLPGDLALGNGGSAEPGVIRKKPARKRGSAAGAAVPVTRSPTRRAPWSKSAVEEGQTVAVGELVVVLEAMKMER